MAAAPLVGPLDQQTHSAAALRVSSPIRIFLLFHKAIRAELDSLHRSAMALATNRGGGDIKQLKDKCHFLRSIYKHHCNAEDEVCAFLLSSLLVLSVSRGWYICCQLYLIVLFVQHFFSNLYLDGLFGARLAITLLEN